MIVFSILASSSLVYAASLKVCDQYVANNFGLPTGQIGTLCAACTGEAMNGQDCLANEKGTGMPDLLDAAVNTAGACDATAGTPPTPPAYGTAAGECTIPDNAVKYTGKCFGGSCLKSCVGSSLMDCSACLSSGAPLTGTPCVGGAVASPFLGQCHAARCVISCSTPTHCSDCMNRNLEAECKIPSYSRLGRCVQYAGKGLCSFICPNTANGHCPGICGIDRQGVPCSYQNSNGRTLPGICTQDGYCVADCKTASLGNIFDTSGTTICSACDSGRKCIAGGNFVGICAQGKCVVDCSMQEKPGDHGRCVGAHRYTGCNNANFGTYCVTAQGLELGVCDDSIRLGNGRLNTCVVACKQTSQTSSSGDKCTTCAADGSRCYTGVYHGRYDAGRAVCVMDCNPQTCVQSNSDCNTACQSCSSSNGCYSTTSLDAVEDVIAAEAKGEQLLMEQDSSVSSPATPSPSTAPSSTGGCSSNGNCRAHEVCDRSICVCDENYEKKGGRCVKVSDTILGVNSTVFAIVLPIVLLLLFGLLAAFCLFSSKSGESNDRGINQPGRRKQKNSELSAAPGTE